MALPEATATAGLTGDEDPCERLARLFDSHQGRLFRLARRLLADREEALDLVQEAYLRAARQVKGLPAGARAEEAWLVRTLVNLCRDRHRRRTVRERALADLAARRDEERDPEEAVVARATVAAALALLSPRRRAVVALHEIEGLPVREVAALLGIADVTARWHLLAARRELTRVLAPVARVTAGRSSARHHAGGTGHVGHAGGPARTSRQEEDDDEP